MSSARSPSRAAHSRPRTTKLSSSNSVPYIPQVENLVLPDGAVGEETAQLLNDLAHPGPHSPLFENSHADHEILLSEEDTETENHGSGTKKLPWWKRPSPWWLLATTPVTAIAGSATMAPRIEVYTSLACRVHKPEIFKQSFPNIDHGIFETETVKVAVDNHSFSFPILPSLILPGLETIIAPSNSFSYQNVIQPANPNLCASDPIVQAAVAKLSTVIAASMGLLTCLLTAWWGSYSDRKGRVRVMTISIVGLLITDLNFLFVSSFPDHVPGGYWFLVVGPILEGLLGGLSTAVAANHAYIADTTTENNRSPTFSLALGLLFAGMGLGPSVGAVLIRYTGKVLSVFYFATSVHFANCIFIMTVIPESLTQKKMLLSRAKYAQDLKDSTQDLGSNSSAFKFLNKFKILFSFLSPLSIFLPAQTESRNPLRKKSRDWSLTLLVISYGFHNLMMGSYTFKFQYAAATFGWTSEIIGYWLSLIGVVRATFLMIILPLVIKIFKPKPVIVETPAELTETQPLLSTDSTSTRRPAEVVKKESHSSKFDLGLANTSLVFEVTFYTLLAFATTAGYFTIFSLLVSLAGGYAPAIQSVAISLYTRQGGTETGRLFGALSVVSSLGSGILGPALYGTVYIKTVATFPRMIFWISVVNSAVALICSSTISLPKSPSHTDLDMDIEDYGGSGRRVVQEDTLVNHAEQGDRRSQALTQDE